MEALRKNAGNGQHCIPEATGDVIGLDGRLLSTETELLGQRSHVFLILVDTAEGQQNMPPQNTPL